MKTYLKVGIIAILVGALIAIFFYKDINQEVKAITNKTNTIYLFQVGVFKDYDNALNYANTYPSSTIFTSDGYYRVIIAIATNNDTLNKLEDYYLSNNKQYYIKTITINKDLINKINEYEKILLKTDNSEVIDSINNSILDIFISYNF